MTGTEHKIASVEEFDEGTSRVIGEVEGREIAVFRYEGEFYAVLNFCVHEGGPLCEGDLSGRMTVGDDGWSWEYEDDGRIVRCPWHSWAFDIVDGKNVKDDRYAVPTYDVAVRDGDIYVVI